MVFRLVLLLLAALLAIATTNILTSPAWPGQSLLTSTSEVPELERRLSFLTWPEERLKVERQLAVALRQNAVQHPFAASSYGRLADLYLNADSQLFVDASEARFAFMSTYNLANSRPEVRTYVASHCLTQSPSFKELDIALCVRWYELLPIGHNLFAIASRLGVPHQTLRKALKESGRCYTANNLIELCENSK